MAFERYIRAAAAAVPGGPHTQADIARIIGVRSASLLSKWFRGLEQPSDASLRTIKAGFAKHGVAVSLRDLAQLAGRVLEDEPGPEIVPPFVEVDPLLAEQAEMLGPDSPLPDLDRAALRALIDRVMDLYRSQMRPKSPRRSA